MVDGAASQIMLDLTSKKTTDIPHLALESSGGESRLQVAPTADGQFVCFALNDSDRTYDVRRRTFLIEGPGVGVRCRIDDGVAYVLQVPLRMAEVLLEAGGEGPGNQADFVIRPMSGGLRALVLSTAGSLDPAFDREVDALVVDVTARRIVHRVHLGTMAGNSLTQLGWEKDGAAHVRFTRAGEVWSDGAAIATLVPLRDGRAVALFADGRHQLLGDPGDAPDVLCMRGADIVDRSNCEPRRRDGDLARIIAGEPPSLPTCPTPERPVAPAAPPPAAEPH